MTRDDSSLTPSRRSVLRYGLAISGGALGSAGANASAPDDADVPAETDRPSERRQSIARARVFPYQWTPGARFEIVDADVDWRPARVRRSDLEAAEGDGEGESRDRSQPRTRTHVIRYDFSSSYRAFLFVDGESESESESGVRPGRRYRFDDSSARSTAGAGLIGVDVTPLE